MRVVFHSGGVFILLGWLVGGGAEINIVRLGSGREGMGEREKRGRRPPGGEAGLAYFLVLAAGNGFSKYSGKMVSAGRNRPRFAIRAHCGLLVTSVSPNCCFLNGILRKSHFPAQSSCENMPAQPSRPAASCPFFPFFPSLPARCPIGQY